MVAITAVMLAKEAIIVANVGDLPKNELSRFHYLHSH